MSFASRMKATAERLLSTYGQELTVQRHVYANYDPEQGEPSSDVYSTYTGVGNPDQYTVDELVDNLVLSTDTKLYFYSTTLPLINDEIEIDNKIMRVLSVNTDKAQGQDCLYVLQLREG